MAPLLRGQQFLTKALIQPQSSSCIVRHITVTDEILWLSNFWGTFSPRSPAVSHSPACSIPTALLSEEVTLALPCWLPRKPPIPPGSRGRSRAGAGQCSTALQGTKSLPAGAGSFTFEQCNGRLKKKKPWALKTDTGIRVTIKLPLQNTGLSLSLLGFMRPYKSIPDEDWY